MSVANNLVVLDGTNPTLDASDLAYEFEKSKFNRKHHTHYDTARPSE